MGNCHALHRDLTRPIVVRPTVVQTPLDADSKDGQIGHRELPTSHLAALFPPRLVCCVLLAGLLPGQALDAKETAV